MNKKIFIVIFLFFLLPLTKACINPTDSFAAEVVLSKPKTYYNLGLFLKARNFLYEEGKYIFQSEYNKNLAAILTEVSAPVCKTNCLSVRLQTPLEEEEIKMPYFSIISSVSGGVKMSEGITNYKGWDIIAGKNNFEFRKDQVSIIISSFKRRNDIIIEVNEKLGSCGGCNGKCIYNPKGNKCIPKEIKESVEEVLKFSGLINRFSELFSSYRTVEAERTLKDFNPVIKWDMDWEEAMRQEIVGLKRKGVINIEDKDIEEIARLAEKGKAGHNSRIVYSEEKERWVYYYDIESPVFVKEIRCEDFPLSKIPKKTLDFKKITLSVYYLIPLLTAFFLALILAGLILIARIITKKRGKKNKKSRKKFKILV